MRQGKYTDLLSQYGQYWFVTITSYGKDIEPMVPDKYEIIKNFCRLSDLAGVNSMGWRYDPVLINSKYTVKYHMRAFDKIASMLSGYTETCIISFVDLYEKVRKNTPGYFFATGIIVILWIVLVPAYKPFMKNILWYQDVDKLFGLVMTLFVFYILYAVQNIFDMTFYGRGATKYMLFESVVTNTIFYGAYFAAYLSGHWVPTLTGIAVMFGCGNAFDTVVSAVAYRYFLKKENISFIRE